MNDFSKVSVWEVFIFSPFLNDPSAFEALYKTFSEGLYKAEATSSFLYSRAIETLKSGKSLTNSFVPSKGSITHRKSESFISSPLSSASIEWVGKFFLISPIMNFSDARSAEVAISWMSLYLTMLKSFLWVKRISPAFLASFSAKSLYSVNLFEGMNVYTFAPINFGVFVEDFF